MSRLVLLALAASLAACAAPASTTSAAPTDPSSAAAPSASASVRLASLGPVDQPDLPAVLRPDPVSGMGTMNHGTRDHGAMPLPSSQAGASPPAPHPVGHASPGIAGMSGMDHAALATAPLADAVAAYLAVHDALAQDRTDPAAAARLAEFLRTTTETAPAADPHLWHRLGEEVTAAQAAADALRRSTTLEQARAAFGTLGVPFSALVTASGSGDGLERHTCGMTDAPEGGVWLQHAGPARNPFFGTAMPMCSRSTTSVTAR